MRKGESVLPPHDPLYIDRRRLRNQAHGAVMLQVSKQSKKIMDEKKVKWRNRKQINRHGKEGK